MSDLPVNVDSSYGDDPADASVAAHQQDHDALHALHNAIAGATPDLASLGIVESADGSITNIVKVTQVAYDALSPPDANTLYIIVG